MVLSGGNLYRVCCNLQNQYIVVCMCVDAHVHVHYDMLAAPSLPLSLSPCVSPPPPSHSPLEFSVTLKKDGQKSLGFSIVGGRNSTRGNSPLFIRSIAPQSISAEDGRLHSGDKITQINGETSFPWLCLYAIHMSTCP